MRLINVHTRKFEEVNNERLCMYAILSHTWGDQEVTYEDFQSGTKDESCAEGNRKIDLTCQQAKEDGLDHVWIDTCCINKTSSAELSEAINSMYRWYSSAQICYVFLYDAWHGEDSFQSCKWFKRGWTLQELLAPGNVCFYDASWKLLGTKESLAKSLVKVTGIALEALLGFRPTFTNTFSVATRMSWAAGRQPTRPEDQAYSLLGLFDVNIPLLYGEGNKAFIRLQEEIVRTSTDQSIFAWDLWRSSPELSSNHILATSPDCFEDVAVWSQHGLESSHHLDHFGLHITLPLLEPGTLKSRNCHYGVLRCRRRDTLEGPIALALHPVKTDSFLTGAVQGALATVHAPMSYYSAGPGAQPKRAESRALNHSSASVFQITLALDRCQTVSLEDTQQAEVRSVIILIDPRYHRMNPLTWGRSFRSVWIQTRMGGIDERTALLCENRFPRASWHGEVFQPTADDPWRSKTGCVVLRRKRLSGRSLRARQGTPEAKIALAFRADDKQCYVLIVEPKIVGTWALDDETTIMDAVNSMFADGSTERAIFYHPSWGKLVAECKYSIRMGEPTCTIEVAIEESTWRFTGIR